MQTGGFLAQSFVYLAAAVIMVPVARRLRLGSVLGYLLGGVAIGPWGLHLVGDNQGEVLHFAEFGVVMMLFLVGLELQPRILWRLRAPILGMGSLQVVATSALIAGLAILLGLTWQAGLAVSMILALSSTAIALQTLSEKGLLHTGGGQAGFSILLFQDIAVIPILAILPLLGAESVAATPSSLGSLAGWQQALLVVGFVALMVGVGRFLARPLFRFIAMTQLGEIFTATALLIVVGAALGMSLLGLSPALGTFLAGVILAESEYRHEIEADIEPFKGLFLGLFFLSVGAGMDFRLLLSHPLSIMGLVLGLLAVKSLVLFGIGRAFRLATRDALLLAAAAAQGGEFAFVLLSFVSERKILPPEVSASLVTAVALSMAASPLLVLTFERWVAPRFSQKKAERAADLPEGSQSVLIAGFGRFGQIVGRLLRANGIGATVLDLDPVNIDTLRRFGLRVFYGDASRADLLAAAGAGKARLLVLAVDDRSKSLDIVREATEHFPNLKIMARAIDNEHAFALRRAGVSLVVRETVGSALELGAQALCTLGFRAFRAERAIRKFRLHEEATLNELLAVHHDEEAYFALARQRSADLETFLRADLTDADLEADKAWDATTLRAEVQGEA